MSATLLPFEVFKHPKLRIVADLMSDDAFFDLMLI